MERYNFELFDPPAPFTRVEIRSQERDTILREIPMLLDSGADVTLVPKSCAEELGLSIDADQAYELMGFNGSISFAPVARFELKFINRIFKGRFLLIDQEWGERGRVTSLAHMALVI